jgi:hypothetical protein
MADENAEPTKNTQLTPDAAEHVAEAHRRLTAMRKESDKYPDLEAAIERLEMALSILTTKTGGML